MLFYLIERAICIYLIRVRMAASSDTRANDKIRTNQKHTVNT